MEQIIFNKLLFKTAFSCMACDGDIDMREVQLIKLLHQVKNFFGEIDINQELENLLLEINRDSSKFLKNYFDELTSTKLSEHDELKLIEVAINTIKADDKIEYAEIKFFKNVRHRLKISDEKILATYPNIEEFLEDDIITDSYIDIITKQFLDLAVIPNFELINLDLNNSN